MIVDYDPGLARQAFLGQYVEGAERRTVSQGRSQYRSHSGDHPNDSENVWQPVTPGREDAGDV